MIDCFQPELNVAFKGIRRSIRQVTGCRHWIVREGRPCRSDFDRFGDGEHVLLALPPEIWTV